MAGDARADGGSFTGSICGEHRGAGDPQQGAHRHRGPGPVGLLHPPRRCLLPTPFVRPDHVRQRAARPRQPVDDAPPYARWIPNERRRWADRLDRVTD
jgi:hypothetical protein